MEIDVTKSVRRERWSRTQYDSGFHPVTVTSDVEVFVDNYGSEWCIISPQLVAQVLIQLGFTREVTE